MRGPVCAGPATAQTRANAGPGKTRSAYGKARTIGPVRLAAGVSLPVRVPGHPSPFLLSPLSVLSIFFFS